MTNPDHQDPNQTNVDETAEVSPETQEAAGAGEASLEVQLESAREELLKFKDATMRAEAEMQNLRRRTERDVENAHKFGIERLVQNLLPVIDSLEKAIEAAEQADGAEQASNKAIIDGVGLCQKMLMDVLGKEGATVINPEGEPFDPNLHQAISIVESPDMEPNSVVMVMQKGYSLNGRLVRPAMAIVSKAPAGGNQDTSGE